MIWHVVERVNLIVILDGSLNAMLHQRFYSNPYDSVHAVTFNLAPLLASRIVLYGSRFARSGILVNRFTTWSTQKSSIRTGFAVWSDCKSLLANITIVKLTWCFLGFLVHSLLKQCVIGERIAVAIIVTCSLFAFFLCIFFRSLFLLLFLLFLLDSQICSTLATALS